MDKKALVHIHNGVFSTAGAIGTEGRLAASLLALGPQKETAHVSPGAVQTRTAPAIAKCALGRGKITVS